MNNMKAREFKIPSKEDTIKVNVIKNLEDKIDGSESYALY